MKDSYHHYTFTGGGSSYNNLRPASMQMSPVCTVSRTKREEFIAECKRIIADREKDIKNAKKLLAKTQNEKQRAELEQQIAAWQETIAARKDSVERETRWIEHEKAESKKITQHVAHIREWLATTGKQK